MTSHSWKLRKEGLRQLWLDHGWALHGYARKTIRGQEFMATTEEEHDDFVIVRIISKADHWREISIVGKGSEKHLDSVSALVPPKTVVTSNSTIDSDTYLVGTNLLFQRGWTKSLIAKFLPEPDDWISVDHWANWTGKKVWALSHVVNVEGAPEFVRSLEASYKRRKLSQENIHAFQDFREESLSRFIQGVRQHGIEGVGWVLSEKHRNDLLELFSGTVQKKIPEDIQVEVDNEWGEIEQHMILKTDILDLFLESSSEDFEFSSFVDYANDHVKNEAVVVESYEAVGAYDEPFDVNVLEYQGIFFVQANEFDDIGFFLEKNEAEGAAQDLAANFQ